MAKSKSIAKRGAKPEPLPVSSIGIIARIWDETGGMSPEVARRILELKFSEADVSRMHEFAERNNIGTITKAELAEWDEYLLAGGLLTVLQLKARRALRLATPAQVVRG